MPRLRPSATDLDTLRQLRESGLTLREVAAELSRRDCRNPWTLRRVWYHLDFERRLQYEGSNDEVLTAAQLRRLGWRRYQVQAGWSALLPERELRPAQVDVLCCVRDYGPQTRRQIAGRLGRAPDLCDTHGQGRLTVGLCRLDLLAGVDWPARYWLTSLARKACQPGAIFPE